MLLESSPIPFRPESIEKISLNEDVQISNSTSVTQPLMKVRGIFQRYDEKNANGRIYPKELFDRCLNEEGWKKRLSENSVIGQVEHPADGVTVLSGPVSHIVTKAWDQNDGTIWGEALVLNTPDGRKIGALLEAGVPVGVSSRGEGEVESIDEATQRVIPESFTLMTWDFVADNSVPGAKVKTYNGESKGSKKSQESLSTSTSKEAPAPLPEKSKDREYLRASPENRHMSKIGEMRKVDVDLKRLKQLNLSKLPFQARVGLTDDLREIRARITGLIKEDYSVEAYGSKLLKEADDFSDDVESDDAGSDDPVAPPDAGADAPPPGGDDAGGEAPVEKEDFDIVMKAVLTSLCPECGDESGVSNGPPGGFPPEPSAGGPPGMESRRRRQRAGFRKQSRRESFPDDGSADSAPPPGVGAAPSAPPSFGGDDAGAGGGDLTSVIDTAYETFCSTGTIDVNAAVAQLKGEDSGDDFGDDPIDSGEGGAMPDEGGGDDFDTGSDTPFESRNLRAAVKVIARLRESAAHAEQYRALVEELKERIRVHHPLLKELDESRKKIAALEGGASWEARISRNKALLSRAKDEIDRWREAFNEEKQVNNAFTALLKEHGIKDASRLAKKIREDELKKGTGETPTRVGGEDKLGRDAGDEGECEEVGNPPVSKKGGESNGVEKGDGETAVEVGGESYADIEANLTEAERDEYESLDEMDKKEFIKRFGKNRKSTTNPGGRSADEEPSEDEDPDFKKKKKKKEESVDESTEHEFLRRIRRQRTGAFRQLNS